jgi:hypothetical protein
VTTPKPVTRNRGGAEPPAESDLAWALRQPVESKMDRWRREAAETSARFAAANRKTVEQKLVARIDAAIAGLRNELLATLRGEIEASRNLTIEATGEALAIFNNELFDHVDAEFAALSKRIDAAFQSRRDAEDDDARRTIDLPRWPPPKSVN